MAAEGEMGVVSFGGKKTFPPDQGLDKSHITSLGASETSYLLCEYNYFPKKIKVAYSVNLKFPTVFCPGLDVFSPDFGPRAVSTKTARGGIPPPPSGQQSLGCLSPLITLEKSGELTGWNLTKAEVTSKKKSYWEIHLSIT